MNWVGHLIDLYDKNEQQVGKIAKKEYISGKQKKVTNYTLLPIAHTTAVAQIEVTIDSEGKFLRARELDKSEGFTIIPCTVSSSSRSGSKVAPHPLCDSLKYIAGDYHLYTNEKEESCREKFEAYEQGLRRWNVSEFAHEKVNAIYQYIRKKSLIHDLVTYQVLQLEEEGKLSNEKIQGVEQQKSFVRFCVENDWIAGNYDRSHDSNGCHREEVWKDQSLIQSFIKYYTSIQQEKGFCYLTGKETFLSETHPKKIRNEGDGAKLISGNDTINFKYRGRFCDKSEAMGVSYEASQKAHNALKWIIRKQGYTSDGLCVVTWASDMVPPINIYDSVPRLLDKVEETLVEADAEEELLWEDLDIYGSDEEKRYDTKEMNATSLTNAIRGYRLNLANASTMVIMAFDAATPGRLALTYYKELEHSKYLKHIEHWQRTCSWLHTAVVEKKRFFYEGMASIRDIALALYGIEQEGRLVLHGNSDGKSPMLLETLQRLTPCVIDKHQIPNDMVRMAVNRASMPLAYSQTNWWKVLSIACSLVKKQRYDYHNKEEWSMNSDMKEICDRSFLYGRLLAIADRIEFTTYDPKDKGKRVTNAKRYMNVFSQRPFSTWKNIEERIQPYLQRQKYKKYYEDILDEVMSMFAPQDFKKDNKLDGLYLLGFHKQSYEFRKKKVEEDITVTNDSDRTKDTKEE